MDEVLAQASTDQVTAAAGQAQNAMLHVLEAEGYPNGELPVLFWDNAQSGDLVGSSATGLFRVIARRLCPKWRARLLLAHLPKAQIWNDSPRTLRPTQLVSHGSFFTILYYQGKLWAVVVVAGRVSK